MSTDRVSTPAQPDGITLIPLRARSGEVRTYALIFKDEHEAGAAAAAARLKWMTHTVRDDPAPATPWWCPRSGSRPASSSAA